MAAFGAQYPVFAPFAAEETDTAMPTYDASVVIGNLVSANMTVTNATGDIWGDDKQIESIEEFASGAIPMETVDMTDDVAAVIYGATVSGGEVEFKTSDEAPYGGLAYFKSLMRNGVKYYKCYFYPKVKAAITGDNAQTKGSSITFQTTTTNFTIASPLYDAGAWMIQHTASTIAEAKEWINEKLGGAGLLAPLTVVSVAGALAGETEVHVNPLKEVGNSYVYKTGAFVTLPALDEVLTDGWTAWNGTDDIEATTGDQIAIVEIDATNKAKKGGIATVAAAE